MIRLTSMRLVGPWAVFGNGHRVSMATLTQMRSYALTFIEDLDSRRCRAHFHRGELRCPRAFAFAKRPLVDAVMQLADGLVQFLD
jgi:hypothetical protein